MRSLTNNIEIAGLPGFWNRLQAADVSLLLLDYDGTLAPFHPDRMQAMPLNGIVSTIEQLIERDDTMIALVSGRPVAEIQQLTGLNSVIIAGTHGFELYRPDAGIHFTKLSPDIQARLGAIEKIAIRIVGPELAERKVATVALHTRKLDQSVAEPSAHEFRRAVQSHIDSSLELRDFDGGVEVRVAGRDKGVAIREIIDELPAADLIVYIGDDDTDEDAFRALPSNGVGIKVGRPDEPTAATGLLANCHEVLKFLTNWIATKTCQ